MKGAFFMKNKAVKVFLLFTLLAILFSTLFVAAILREGDGMKFEDLSEYKTESAEMPLPLTYEATVCFPADFGGNGGVIFGSKFGDQTPGFNFEVQDGGSPRIYIFVSEKVTYDIIFDDVNIYSGEKTYIAITLDQEAGTWSCYTNGELADTVTAAVPDVFNMTSVFALGCNITAGNSPFKGELFDVALYKDKRSADEIALDAAGGEIDTNDLITAYSPLRSENEKKSITAIGDEAYNITYKCEWIKNLAQPEDYAYSFAVIGDIQSMTYYYPELLVEQFEWIRDNADDKKIAFSVGLGDITEKNTAAEYLKVIEAYDKIDGVVPFSIIRGNHERTSSNDTTMYDTYITQDRYGDEITGSYDDTMHNTYRIIQIGKVKYMFMNLDLVLSDGAIEWANEIIAEHPECHVIVSTHVYKNAGGSYIKNATNGKFGTENDSEVLWDRLLSQHENIVMLLYGHSPKDTIWYKQREGIHGNIVTEMLINPSETDKTWGGGGFIAMFYFSEDGEQLDIQYYSTAKDAYFKSQNQFSLDLDTPGTVEFTNLIMNVGADQSERNLTWYTQYDTEGEVRYAKSTDGTLPLSYSTVKATAVKAAKPGYYSYKTTMVGLEENSTYVYCLVVGDVVSECYTFNTYSMGDDFSFAFVTDPQVKQSSHAALWDDTLSKIKNSFDGVSIVVSAGDQTSDPALEDNFDWFISEHLSSLAISTTVGPPHDNSLLYKDHYNLPNLSSKYGISTPSSDYFYTYNNVLFMHLNVENKDYDGHVEFMENAISDNPDCIWRVVVLHYSFFSGGNHSVDGSVLAFRNAVAGKFSELDVDVVLSGHDHVYARSQMMINGNTLSGDVVTNGSVTNPDGTLYICGTSSTGSGWYSIEHHDDDAYIAFSEDTNRKSVVIFTVSEGSLTLKSYFIDGSVPEEFDRFTINKSEKPVRLNSANDMLEILDGADRVPLVNAYAYASATVKVVDGYWSVSTDGGASFNSLGIASTDALHVLRINPSTGYWELSSDGGASFESLEISTNTYTVKYVTIPGATYGDTTDISGFFVRRFTAATPDAPVLYMPKGSMSEGNLYDWSWEYYLVGSDGTPVTSFAYGESYVAYPVSSSTPIASTIYISDVSVPEEYIYTWQEAWDIVSRCAGERITLSLKSDVTLTAEDAISVVTPVDLTLDLAGKRLDTSVLGPALKFAVGSNGSSFTVITSLEGGTLNAGSNDFIEIGSNQGSKLTIQYGSTDTEALTVESARYLVGANGNFKYTSTLNLSVFGGSYTVTRGIIYVSNVSETASRNIYKFDLKDAAFNFSGGESAIVRRKAANYGASDASYIIAEGCVFTDTYKANHSSSRAVFHDDCWLGTASFVDCDFVGMSVCTTYAGEVLTNCGTITIGNGCTFTNSTTSFKTENPLSFRSEKVVLATGSVIARTDAAGSGEVVSLSDAVEITWENPVGYKEYWKRGTTPSYLGESSFTAGGKTYSLRLSEQPIPAIEDKTYSFVSAEGYLYRYDSNNGVWQISTDGGNTYTNITEAEIEPDPDPISGCTVTIDGVSTTYPADTDFGTILSSIKALDNIAGKEISIVLGSDMTVSSGFTFNKSAVLKIDLAGHKLTVAAGKALQFSSRYTLQLYSSVTGAELIFASSKDSIQPGTGTLIFGSETYKNTLTVTSPKGIISCGQVSNGSTLCFKFLYCTVNTGDYGVLRLNAKGAGAVTLEAEITGCTVKGSASAVLYSEANTLTAEQNGGVFTTGSYINATDSIFTCTAEAAAGFFGHANFTDRYFGTASFTECTFNNYILNGDLIRSDEAISYNTYYDTIVSDGYDPTKTITVGADCAFYNYGDTFREDITGFSASNVSLASDCRISIAADHVKVVSDSVGCQVVIDGASTAYPSDTDFKDVLAAINNAANAGKVIHITLESDMTLNSTYRFAGAAGYTLNIDLAGNKLTIGAGGRLRFGGAGFTVNIYSSKEGGELVFNTADDGIQLDASGLFVFGSNTHKDALTVSAVGEMLNISQLQNGSKIQVKYLYCGINCGSNGILRLNAKGDGAVTLEAEITGCTVNGSSSIVYYNSSSSLSATANGGVYSVDSYINATDSIFTCTAEAAMGFFGNANFTDRYFGTVSFMECTFNNYILNGDLIRSDEALGYNSYYDTVAGEDYDPAKTVTVGKNCVFYNYGSTFMEDMTGFSASNVSVAPNCEINVAADHVKIVESELHADGDDNDHLCDCGCGKVADEGCYDTDPTNGKCDECGADVPHAHTGGTATCQKKAICSICSTEYGALAQHSAETAWRRNETHHYHLCIYWTEGGTCEERFDYATHEDGDENGRCDECDYQMSPGTDDPGTDPNPEPPEDNPPEDNPPEDNTPEDNTPEDGPSDENDGIGTGAIVGIVLGSVAGLGGGIFALFWFVIRKKYRN